MADKGFTCFSKLTPAVCIDYVNACKKETNKRGKPHPPRTLAARIAPLETLYQFREYLLDAPPEHPWPGQSAFSLAGVDSRASQCIGKTEMIPDRLSKKLAKGSLHYIEERAEELLMHRSEQLAGKDDAEYWGKAGYKGRQQFQKELGFLLTSCYVVIDQFSGIRDSEMASLDTDCYYEHEGWDGATYGWIKGMLYKTEEDPTPGEWMVPPVVAKAVEVATKVTAPLRAKLQARIEELEARIASAAYLSEEQKSQDVEDLTDIKKHINSLFLSRSFKSSRISAWSGQATRLRLKQLAERLELRVEASDLAQVQKTNEIHVGDIWPLAPHQFRKTFGVYVARNVLGDVRYLREHFKHWSLDMTLYYAAKGLDYIDQGLFDEVLSERDELQAIIIEGWISTDSPITGEGSRKIKEWRERDEVRVAKDHRDLARKMAIGFYIRGTGHSWCTSETCKGMGLYDVLVCAPCENRIIDNTHRLVWHGIREQQIELLAMDDLGDPMWERATKHLRYAEKILGELGDVVEPYPFPPKPSEQRNRMAGVA